MGISYGDNWEYRPDKLGEPREVAPGAFMWVPGTATFPGVAIGGAVYTVTIRLGLTADGARPVSVQVAAPDGGSPVTGAVLRAVPVGELAQAIIGRAFRGARQTTADGEMQVELFSLSEDDAELIRLRGPVPSSLSRAAEIYNAAVAAGLDPARQVELVIGLPRTTVTRWVRRAREMGLIGPAEGK